MRWLFWLQRWLPLLPTIAIRAKSEEFLTKLRQLKAKEDNPLHKSFNSVWILQERMRWGVWLISWPAFDAMVCCCQLLYRSWWIDAHRWSSFASVYGIILHHRDTSLISKVKKKKAEIFVNLFAVRRNLTTQSPSQMNNYNIHVIQHEDMALDHGDHMLLLSCEVILNMVIISQSQLTKTWEDSSLEELPSTLTLSYWNDFHEWVTK